MFTLEPDSGRFQFPTNYKAAQLESDNYHHQLAINKRGQPYIENSKHDKTNDEPNQYTNDKLSEDTSRNKRIEDSFHPNENNQNSDYNIDTTIGEQSKGNFSAEKRFDLLTE